MSAQTITPACSKRKMFPDKKVNNLNEPSKHQAVMGEAPFE